MQPTWDGSNVSGGVAWRRQLRRGAPLPRAYAYELAPAAKRTGCGCVAAGGDARCRNATLIVTCGAPRAALTIAETRRCELRIDVATTELCAALQAAPDVPPHEPVCRESNWLRSFADGVFGAVLLFASLCIAESYSPEYSPLAVAAGRQRDGAAQPARRRPPPAAVECPVCMEPITTGAFADCGRADHAVCAGCLHAQARQNLRELAAALVAGAAAPAAEDQQLQRFMACPQCPGGAISFAAARGALQRAGNALGDAEAAHAEALGAELAARRGVEAAVQRLASGGTDASTLARRLCDALRVAACPACGAEYGLPSDACNARLLQPPRLPARRRALLRLLLRGRPQCGGLRAQREPPLVHEPW